MSTFSLSDDNKHNILDMRLQIDYLLDNKAIEKEDVKDVVNGLKSTPKSIPARYFYDRKGSQLFEQICELEEYYPTRTEASILKHHAGEIVQQTKAFELVELGSGSSTKTRFILDVYQDLNIPLCYTPVDVSGSMLEATANNLLQDYPQLKIQAKVATYDQALEELSTYFLGKRLIIFLGSSIGNLSPQKCDRFLERITTALNPGDYFLLGIDLYKPIEILEAAYNDKLGVTAEFNLNMLQHLNHRFRGNFDLNLFKHKAIYNRIANQIEMYLVSQQQQVVNLEDLNLVIELDKNEEILTEISRKFNLIEMEQYLNKNNLNLIQTYTDSKQWFALVLAQKTATN